MTRSGKKTVRKSVTLDKELILFLYWFQNWEGRNGSELIRNLVRGSSEFKRFLEKKEVVEKDYLSKISSDHMIFSEKKE